MLNAAQVATSEAEAALEGNMVDMKSVMQGHIGKAEVKLGQLQSWQEDLAGKQDEFHTGIQEELHHIKMALEASTRSHDLSATTVLEPSPTTEKQ